MGRGARERSCRTLGGSDGSSDGAAVRTGRTALCTALVLPPHPLSPGLCKLL